MANTESRSRARYLGTLLASSALVSAGGVQAQAGGGSQSAVIEEIVVRGVARQFRPEDQATATGLSMSLINTPQSVTVLTTEMLETINASSVYGATDLVPNVQRSGYGFGLERIVMRGIVNANHRVNGILMGARATSLDGFMLDRLEVVRGPATVVYGVTGSFGGEINSILKRPEHEFGFEAGGEIGSYDSHNLFADVTGSITDDGRLRYRLIGKYEEFGLPLDIRGEDFPNYQSTFMGSVAWDVAPTSTLTLSWLRQRRNIDPWDGASVVLGADGTLSLPDANPEQWYFSHPDQSNSVNQFNIGMAEFEHEFANGWRSTTQVAYNEYEEFIEYFYAFGPFGAYNLGDDEIYIYTYDTDRDGEELTFNQSLGGDFEFMGREHQFFAALEYSDNLSPDRFELLSSQFAGIASIDMFGKGVYDGVTPRFADGSAHEPISTADRRAAGVGREQLVDTTDLRLSFQMMLNPTDRLQLLGGVLYQDSTRKERAPFLSGEAQPDEVTKTSFDEFVFRFGATYGVLENVGPIDAGRIYYSYSEGFEPQTFLGEDGNFTSAPQEMTQHEIGLKTELFGGSVGASIALFDYEITNRAVSGSFVGGFDSASTAVLAGTQDGRGLELELVGEVLPGWNVSANYGYLDATISDPNFDFSGRPRSAPKHSGAITTTYEFLDGSFAGLRIGATFKASGDYAFVEGPSNVNRFGPLVDGAHERLDLHASYTPVDPRFQNFTATFNWVNVFDTDIMMAKEGNPGFGVMFLDQQRMSLGLRYKL